MVIQPYVFGILEDRFPTFSASNLAVTEESTPPDIPTTTLHLHISQHTQS